MSKKSSNPLSENKLEERIFSLFPRIIVAKIAEKIGTSRQIVQGWKSGKSRPTLEQLGNICVTTKVDWQWLVTGRTSDSTALAYAYFPINIDENIIFNVDLYNAARELSSYFVYFYLWPEKKALYEHAIAVFWRASTDKNAINPLALPRDDYDDVEIDSSDSLSFYKEIPVPPAFLRETHALLGRMEKDFFDPVDKETALHRAELNRKESQHISTENISPQPNSTRPREPISGEETILPQLSRYALELMNELNDIHMRALNGAVTEEQFKAILAAATASIADEARKNGVEPKKAIG